MDTPPPRPPPLTEASPSSRRAPGREGGGTKQAASTRVNGGKRPRPGSHLSARPARRAPTAAQPQHAPNGRRHNPRQPARERATVALRRRPRRRRLAGGDGGGRGRGRACALLPLPISSGCGVRCPPPSFGRVSGPRGCESGFER